MPIIQFESVFKSYSGSKPVINNLNLEIKKGDFITFLGLSGCGKTTLLKMVNKLITPDSGAIKVMDKKLSDWDTIELRRSIGYVIQQIGLFPHLNIMENIAYVLTLLKKDKKEKETRAKELINIVGLDESYLYRYPSQLSGGQRQRVGVARALASNPEIVLMDEPFGAVDEITRTTLQDELLSIYKKLNKTILFVTHDIEEALKLGSKIVLLNSGNIEQMGSKDDLIYNPKSEFVKQFFGVKGFKAILNNTALKELYNKVLNKEVNINKIKFY